MAPGLLISLLVAVIFLTAVPLVVHASDPNPKGADGTNIDGDFLTFRGLRPLLYGIAGGHEPDDFTVAKASSTEFPALHGQGVSCAVLTYPGMSLNPPHYHTRASELLFVIEGTLLAGVIDGANRLRMQKLEEGDMFVFPRGLVHFQFNVGSGQATALSAFGSADAGTVSVPGSVVSSRIANDVLEKAFRTDAATIQEIKARLASKLYHIYS